MHCEICGGELTLLGRLAHLIWFRCRRCGIDQNRTMDEVDIDLAFQEN